MKAAIIIPFRDNGDGERDAQLKILLNRISEINRINRQEYKVYVINQADNQLFNRASLINSGVGICKDECGYFILHDVDNIPITNGDVYRKRGHTGNVCGEIDGKKYTDIDDHFGDVVHFNKEDYFAINGMSNYYWGWGFECSATPLRLRNMGIEIRRGDGVFKQLRHETKYRFNGNPNFVNNVLIYNLVDINMMEGYNETAYELAGIDYLKENAYMYHVKLPKPQYDTTRNITPDEIREWTGKCDKKLYDWVIETYQK